MNHMLKAGERNKRQLLSESLENCPASKKLCVANSSLQTRIGALQFEREERESSASSS